MKKVRSRISYILLAAFLALTPVFGQNTPEVHAKLEPDSICIGDRVTLRVTVDKDAMQVVDFPVFEQLQGGGSIEVLGEWPVDTLSRTGRRVMLEKRYSITSFDEGIYSMGKIPVMYADKNIVDTLRSRDTLVLKVTTFEIDTTKQQIFDIKPPLAVPLSFGEISGYILWAFLGWIILGLLIWMIVRLINKQPIIGPARTHVLEPAHIVALRELDKLYNQKTLMTEKHKAYYTALTDILREYIGRRYDIAAKEMTSAEIIAALHDREAPERNVKQLRGMFDVADLVKFAKFAPDLDVNEQSFFTAYHFVDDTKEAEIQSDKKEDEQ